MAPVQQTWGSKAAPASGCTLYNSEGTIHMVDYEDGAFSSVQCRNLEQSGVLAPASLGMGAAVSACLPSSQTPPLFLDTCAEVVPGEALGRVRSWEVPTG